MTSSVNKHLGESVKKPSSARDKRPTVHLTSWDAHHLHGPGRRYSIMARPWRDWEFGDGHVRSLSPEPQWLDEIREGFLSYRAYEWQCRQSFIGLHPGYLAAENVIDWYGNSHEREVKDGDTLCCTCGVDAAEAGLCHRIWAAEALAAAGWRVLLDGEELGCEPETRAAA